MKEKIIKFLRKLHWTRTVVIPRKVGCWSEYETEYYYGFYIYFSPCAVGSGKLAWHRRPRLVLSWGLRDLITWHI